MPINQSTGAGGFDLIMVNVRNLRKLFTKEDPLNLHKLLGFASLIHYVYRFRLWITVGSMKFDNSYSTLIMIILHAALSFSSLMLHIPKNRVAKAPMIYPEFRAHSILFAMRSLVVMFIMWYQDSIILRGIIVLVTAGLADYITSIYADNGTTMRAMPFPDSINQDTRDVINLYYSVSQVLATMEMMYAKSMDSPFLILFPIQLAALLMTLVRKSILTSLDWHITYAVALGLNYLRGFLLVKNPNQSRLFFWPTLIIFCVARFRYRVDKYLLWTAAIIAYWKSCGL